MTAAWAAGPFEPVYNVRAFGAINNGSADDSPFIQEAIDACIADGGGTVFFPVGVYLCENTLLCGAGVMLRGAGAPGAVVDGATQSFAQIHHNFDGDLIKFDGSIGSSRGTGCGVEDLVLVQVFGTDEHSYGTAIKAIGTTLSSRPNWLRIANVQCEQKTGSEGSWTICVDIDGSAVDDEESPGVRDVFIGGCRLNQGEDGTHGVRLTSVFNAFLSDLEVNLGSAKIEITGISTNRSSNINLCNCAIGELRVDFAQNVTVAGGAYASIEVTSNALGQIAMTPGRLVGAFTNSATAGVAVLFCYSADDAAWMSQGAGIRVPWGLGFSGRNSAGFGVDLIRVVEHLISTVMQDFVAVDSGATGLILGKSVASNGSSSSATLGNVGGAGRPTSSPQAGWKEFNDTDGSPYWVPIWR